MKTINGVKVSKEMQRHIKGKMSAMDEPYIFKIQGTPGPGLRISDSAAAAFEKIKAWAEKNYAAVELIENDYVKSGNKMSSYLKVKITDPAAYVIEELLKPCQHTNVKITKDIPGMKYFELRECEDCGKQLSK